MTDDIEPEEKTLYITPNIDAGRFDFIENPVMPLQSKSTSHIHNVTSFRHQHTPAASPAFVRFFLPPYEFSLTGLHDGGGTTSLKRKRVRARAHARTRAHTHKRRQQRHRSKSMRSKS
jgi:hypothetical protein